ncbi:MAG: ExbD/TolR family protein [Brevinema sp.]
MFSKYKKANKLSTDINMAPMIDIVFQLLTFFMITSTFIQTASLSVSLPESKTSDTIQNQQSTITLYKDGMVSWNDQTISPQDLSSKMSELYQEDPESVLVIQGDEGISYGALIKIMDQARNTGLTKLSLATILKR